MILLKFRSELSMVTFMLIWSISFLPLVLGKDDHPTEGLQVKIIKESKDLQYTKDQNDTCEDDAKVVDKCSAWADNGECFDNPKFMLKKCRKSCKVCGGTCEDDAKVAGSCPVWAGHGECSENPAFMLAKCRKSCDPCGGICATESTAQPGDHLSVHYTGRFDNENGKVFDTSHNSGQLYKFQLGAGQVIQGYERGVPGMCKGETRTLTVPPHLAYGDGGYPGSIPGGATLHFTVELVKIKKGKLRTLPSGPRGEHSNIGEL